MSVRIARQSKRHIFAAPVLLGLAVLLGLILGLTGDGWRDAACWLLLATPVIIVARAWHRRDRHPLR